MTQPRRFNESAQQEQPRDDLDVAFSIIRSSEYDELLEQINFGTGYYSDKDLQMQMRNVRKGLVTNIAFSRTLRKHAERETKTKLADEGFAYYNESKDETQIWKPLDDLKDLPKSQYGAGAGGRTTALLARGEEIWDEMSRPEYSLSIEQAAALDAKASMSNFKPIFNHLAALYHEQTKSKGARTQDNFFGRVKRNILEGDTDSKQAKNLLGRGGKQ